MKSTFSQNNENRAEVFRTDSLLHAFEKMPGIRRRFIRVAAIVKSHFLGTKGWSLRIHNGSLTFQHRKESKWAVKLFIDLGNALARKADLGIHKDPIALGIELTEINTFVRESIRDKLSEMFGDYYLDPRKPRKGTLLPIPNDKYWISPHHAHVYDILFLPKDFEKSVDVDFNLVSKLEKRIMAGLKGSKGE